LGRPLSIYLYLSYTFGKPPHPSALISVLTT
jgi:hypothetical protein